MVKFIYIIGLFIVSFLLFVFSKEKITEQCSNETRGVIILNDTSLNFLILTEENKKLAPQTIARDVVLVHSEAIVSVCYKVDSSKLVVGSEIIPVNIERVVRIK